MEAVVALTDSLVDAIYAAEKYGAKLIYDALKKTCITFRN